MNDAKSFQRTNCVYLCRTHIPSFMHMLVNESTWGSSSVKRNIYDVFSNGFSKHSSFALNREYVE